MNWYWGLLLGILIPIVLVILGWFMRIIYGGLSYGYGIRSEFRRMWIRLRISWLIYRNIDYCKSYIEPALERLKNSDGKYAYYNLIDYMGNYLQVTLSHKCVVCKDYTSNYRRVIVDSEMFVVCSYDCLFSLVEDKRLEYMEENKIDEPEVPYCNEYSFDLKPDFDSCEKSVTILGTHSMEEETK